MTHFKHDFRQTDARVHQIGELSASLIAEGLISPADARDAVQIARRQGLRVADVLTSNFGVPSFSIANAFSVLYQCRVINPFDSPPHLDLVDKWGAAQTIRSGIMPWRKIGSDVVVLTDKPDQFDRYTPALTAIFGPIRMAITTQDYLQKSIVSLREATLCDAAETKVALNQSSRMWNARRALQWGTFVLMCLALVAVFAPAWTVIALCIWAICVLVLTTMLKGLAAVVFLRNRADAAPPPAVPARLPKITLLVPLFRETHITQHLLARLSELDYPKELLDVCLVTESDDITTREALGQAVLPMWMRAIVVPQGTLRTKPRALNFALDFAKGSIIGVYDAEDAPAPDQLQRVAAQFANRGPQVACLQGVLDYYNDSSNWLTRCFTIEYASWFRVLLPGLDKLGLVVPLGGTTLFFRADILEELGGWDAHNVTEDADLGVRLARAGYRTELIETVTQEEANGHFWPWIKQRSRWLKGYAITYAVHMRSPRKLWVDLGAKRFLGFQLLFAGTLSQFVLAPVLWSFWLLPLGIAHPFADILSPMWFWALAGVFFASELINLIVAAIALRAARKIWLVKWAITLQLYFPLAAVAAYKGLVELAWKPYYWDKTTHGVLLPRGVTAQPPPPVHPVSSA